MVQCGDVSPSCRSLERGMHLPPEDLFGSMFHKNDWGTLLGGNTHPKAYHHDVAQKCTPDSPAGHGTSPNQSDKPDATRATCPTCNNMRQHTSTCPSLVFMYAFIRTSASFRTSSQILGKKYPKRHVKSGESWTFPLGPDCLQIFCCQSAFSCLRKPWNHIGTIHDYGQY